MARDPRNTALVLASDYADAAIPRATRLAAAGDQNFLQKAMQLFKGGKAGGATRVLSKAGLPLAGLSVLGSAMAAGEDVVVVAAVVPLATPMVTVVGLWSPSVGAEESSNASTNSDFSRKVELEMSLAAHKRRNSPVESAPKRAFSLASGPDNAST